MRGCPLVRHAQHVRHGMLLKLQCQAPQFCLPQLPCSGRCAGERVARCPREFRFWCVLPMHAAGCGGVDADAQRLGVQVTGSLHLVGDFLRILRPRQ